MVDLPATISAIGSLAGAILGGVAAIYAARAHIAANKADAGVRDVRTNIGEVKSTVEKLELNTNSLTTAALETAERAASAEGIAQGRREVRQEIALKDAGRAAAMLDGVVGAEKVVVAVAPVVRKPVKKPPTRRPRTK